MRPPNTKQQLAKGNSPLPFVAQAPSCPPITAENQPTNQPLTVTVNAALAISSLGRTKLNQLLSNGKIQSVRVGTRRLINFTSLKNFLEAGE